MKILALDCTGVVATAAIVTEDKVVCEFNINNKLTHAENLMPMVLECFKFSETDKSEIDFVAVTSGPGSFTGLRIGAATAKSIAHGLGVGLIPVPTLDSLAYNIFSPNCTIIPIMDARRGECYCAIYEQCGYTQKRVSDYMAAGIDKILGLTDNYNNQIIFLGDAAPVYKDIIIGYNKNFLFAHHNNNMQRAASVGRLAINNTGSAIPYSGFKPFYIRLPQAEMNLS
ncbi:MAG: tRNA (adenosine(37)-N6)-threonylcarbamoyltransferase complex dimerization subunit type 1 TsaB [Clostridiales bacterium]|jgi:tRNA threonylcarbamoyladenosine biosynthesis protein TsaB|nr:tRNA (adenosine(37)-N6)-threonylcarbamoyltransferase complex dimerization subunit type 1 TsaB [Clostridiales bacterium]